MRTPSASTYDAVVVGARPAGAATAMILARAGLRVLVVDRGHYGADTVSTHALLRGGVLQLSRWGLLERVVAAGTPAATRTVFHYGADRVEVPIRPNGGVDALYAPRRTVLDPILVDAAQAAGAEVRFGVAVSDLCRDRDGRVTGVVGQTQTGADFAARARIVVGADGLGSTIAKLVRAPVDRHATNSTGFIYGYWRGLPVDEFALFYRPGITAGVFPTNGGEACVFVGTSRRRFRREARSGVAAAYARLLREVAPEVTTTPNAVAPEWLRVFAGRRAGFLRRAAGAGWALVGDAGYFKDPITSHGLTDALRDAELLGRAIVTAAEGVTPEAVALGDYQATRDRLSSQVFTVTDSIASFAWDLDQIPALLLRLSEAMRDEMACLTELSSDSDRACTARPHAIPGRRPAPC